MKPLILPIAMTTIARISPAIRCLPREWVRTLPFIALSACAPHVDRPYAHHGSAAIRAGRANGAAVQRL